MAEIAAEQNAIVSVAQLRACGLSTPAITLRTRRGTLHRVYRGVYSLVPTALLTPRGRYTAAVLACGEGAVLSHGSAAVWWELLPYEARPPDVIVAGDQGRKIDGIRPHRIRRLDRRDAWPRSGVLVTSPARTALDLAARMTDRALRRMLRQAQADGRVSLGQLQDVHTRAGNHPGAKALLAVIADGPTPTRSVAEDLLLDLLDQAGLDRPEVNPLLMLEDGTLMPDFLWRGRKLVVEVDGARFHSGRQARREDGQRQARLEAGGYRVLRVTYEQLAQHPAQTIARIRRAL